MLGGTKKVSITTNESGTACPVCGSGRGIIGATVRGALGIWFICQLGFVERYSPTNRLDGAACWPMRLSASWYVVRIPAFQPSVFWMASKTASCAAFSWFWFWTATPVLAGMWCFSSVGGLLHTFKKNNSKTRVRWAVYFTRFLNSKNKFPKGKKVIKKKKHDN